MGKEMWESTGSVGLLKYLFPFVKMGYYDFLFLNFERYFLFFSEYA